MSTPRATSAGTPDDSRSPFQKFQDLTRRILTTPKNDLMGPTAPKKHPAKGKKK